MLRSLKALALTAVLAGGALTLTVAPASAANLNVYFNVLNNDSSQNMGIISISSTISGLSAGPISPGAYDPASGHATWSDALPVVGGTAKTASFTTQIYGGGAPCTFTLRMIKDTNMLPYLLQVSNNGAGSRCPVPADQRSSDGQFTSTTTLPWASQ
jgi:hypothetical protein